jgi:hypothetical protein
MPTKITPQTSDWKPVAARFLNQRYLSPPMLDQLQAWYAATEGGPLTLADFLQPQVATGLATALRRFASWSRYATIFEGHVRMAEIEPERWPSHPDRAARQYLARPLVETLDSPATSAADRRALGNFLGFAVTGGYLLSWLSTIVGRPLEPRTSFEFACYGPGDSITEHDDLLPGRILAANCYLDDSYLADHGGQLHYRDEHGREYRVDPEFNSFTLIPIRTGCVHWVSPYRGSHLGRFTANFQIHTDY